MFRLPARSLHQATIFSLLLATALVPPALGQQSTWIGNNYGVWGDTANWSNGVPDSAAAEAILPGSDWSDIDLAAASLTLNRLTSEHGATHWLQNGVVHFSGTAPQIAALGGGYGVRFHDTTTVVFDERGIVEGPGYVDIAGKLIARNGIEKRGGGSLNVSDVEGDILVSDGGITVGKGAPDHGRVTGRVTVAHGSTAWLSAPAVVGSLAGAGEVTLNHSSDGKSVQVGTDNADAVFSGRLRGLDVDAESELVKVGSGNWTLSGNSDYEGATRVQAGTLTVTGGLSKSRVSVGSGATVAGTGSIHQLEVQSGGILAPGAAGSKLTIAGDADNATADLVLKDGATYRVAVTPAGDTSSVHVGGNAEVGNVRVEVAALAGSYAPAKIYRILTAGGQVTKTGQGFQATPMAFLSAEFDYSDPTAVSMQLQTKAGGLSGSAATPNQAAVAGALEGAGTGNSLYQAVLFSGSISDAQFAFDNLSGESHATAQSAFAQATGQMRQVVIDRLSSAETGGDGVMSMVDTGEEQVDLSAPERAVWGTAYGSYARIGGTPALGGSEARSGGIVAGLDGVVGDWRIGALLNLGSTRIDASGRSSTLNAQDYGFGVYGGTSFGQTSVKLGVNHVYHDVSSSRTVSVPGLESVLRASYGASTTQAFGEVAHALEVGQGTVEPFAQLGVVRQQRNGFTETGGAAAISAVESVSMQAFATLGVRASVSFELENDMKVTLDGGLAYRHTWGGDAQSVHAFAGSPAFTVAGVSAARDVALLNAGIALGMGSNLSVGVTYEGEYSGTDMVHTAKAGLSLKF
ncbi:MAG TPA: autotransporter domain-containing protein [Devosia sp.]|jgi:autotransporter-associated beta strand protein|uniref:autotransporter outer membrane beta-barrel domain-containing protein n=1 Tax=Devosia sp. TaxID=1871048 RepID=UPI002F9215D5